MTKLFCGHVIPNKFYAQMAQKHNVRCPKCGLSWRGWKVISNDKALPKKEIRAAQQRGKMTSREFFRK